MKAYKVTFADGNSLVTSMNADIDEARAYYVGQSFELDETKPRVRAVSVEYVSDYDLAETETEAHAHVAAGRTWPALKESKSFDAERLSASPLFDRRLF
jgi:hypothetical protein